MLAAGRVALGLHYPTDVIGGAGLGAAVSLLLFAPAVRGHSDGLADAVGRLIDAVLWRRRTRTGPAAWEGGPS